MKKLFSFLVFYIGLSVSINAQDLQYLNKKFDTYRSHALQEKVYISTDRNSYLTGETIWFKVYLTDASVHKTLTLSKVVYIELLDNQNQPLLQTKIAMKNGMGEGSFFVPASINSGNFTLRGYTKWMRNFSAEFYFSKNINIINPFVKLEPQEDSTTDQFELDAQFFPEGGNLVHGVKSKVGFRITDAAGKGVSYRGFLLNQQNDTIVRFTPTRFGLGNFTFTPVSDHSYHVLITDEKGKTYSSKFPKVNLTGFTLSVSDTLDGKLKVTVRARIEDMDLSNSVYLFVHARNIISNSEVRFLQRNQAVFLIDKNSLSEGISHFTVFNAKFDPVCERLYFKNPTALSIMANSDQKGYGTRRKVRIDVQTNRPNANLSISVFKTDSLFQDAPVNINSYFWLTSDLKGRIESPEYYLNNPSDVTSVDNLMLTHGWRRFHWQDILHDTPPAINFIPEYRGHIVQGIVKKENQPVEKIMTYLTAPGKAIQLYASRSNEKGEIKFEMQNFTGSTKLILHTNSKKDSLFNLEILNPFSDQYSSLKPTAFHMLTKNQDQILQRSVAMQVQDIFYRDSATNILTDSTTFYGKANETYYLDAYTRFPVMEEVLREYVPGVYLRKRKNGFHFMVRDDINRSVFSESPLILLDGVPVFDEDEIMSFSPLKIKRLDVVTKRYYLGPLTMPGIVSFITYTGDLSGFQLNPNSLSLNYEGLQAQREFFSPRYENQKLIQSRLPDQRYLLYWNPMVNTQQDGKYQIEFYTSDIPGEYRIFVEGMTSNGIMGSTENNFSVKSLNH